MYSFFLPLVCLMSMRSQLLICAQMYMSYVNEITTPDWCSDVCLMSMRSQLLIGAQMYIMSYVNEITTPDWCSDVYNVLC